LKGCYRVFNGLFGRETTQVLMQWLFLAEKWLKCWCKASFQVASVPSSVQTGAKQRRPHWVICRSHGLMKQADSMSSLMRPRCVLDWRQTPKWIDQGKPITCSGWLNSFQSPGFSA